MAFQRGDIVLIPFPFTDLTATKTRPAIVVSGAVYHSVRSELLLAYHRFLHLLTCFYYAP